MPFQVSPGVNVSEIDLTTVIPAVSTTTGAIAGRFNWGPADKRILVSSEEVLAQVFSTPDSNNFQEFFTAANFLAYGNALFISRVLNEANNASASGVGKDVRNDDHYENNYDSGIAGAGDWVAKYPGALGNSLKVSFCQSAAAFESTVSTANLTFTAASATVTANANNHGIVAGDFLRLANATADIDVQVKTVSANGLTLTLETSTGPTGVVTGVPTTEDLGGSSLVSNAVKRRWEYFGFFDSAPGTSDYVTNAGGSNDEIHIAVIDEDGEITGTQKTVIERWPAVSMAADALTDDGTANYYKEVINQRSSWIWWASAGETLTNSGSASTTSFTVSSDKPQTVSLSGGDDGTTPTTAQVIAGYDHFKSAEDVDVSLILGADANQTVATHIINNICETRKDCVVTLSPESTDVVNNSTYPGKEAEDAIAFRNTLPSSSYAIMDSSYKYQYDKYNDVYRYVPMNGDTAGLMVRTDTTRDPWFSPAGFNRGNVKNVVKLSYNPPKADRDLLYKAGINPVVSFPGQGTVLFGDKTMLAKPSAFDRINVRRLFIVLEKAISTASKFTLFEFNDAFTRSQFRNLVEPFLRDVQGRRGIFDFRVVCDETNNTGEVIDRNEFIGDIYIKPARSINFIQLNFIAVRTGVDFEEVVGKF